MYTTSIEYYYIDIYIYIILIFHDDKNYCFNVVIWECIFNTTLLKKRLKVNVRLTCLPQFDTEK